MKVSVLVAGLANPHAGWVAIDELAELLVHYFEAELLSPKILPQPWLQGLLRPHQVRWEPLHTQGGDVLIVVARGPGDLGMISAIANCRKKFKRIIGFVTDSYFQAGFVRETAQFDAITVTAHEDVDYPRSQFGIAVHQLYQGADCLTWVPQVARQREIDLMGFGRTPPSYQAALTRSFHPATSPYLYLHSPLGHLAGSSVHLERGMLFKLLQRTRISLAFHLFVEPQGQRPRAMMVTSRWLESLLSGCIVAGKRPVSRMADEMLCWPGATLELSDNPAQAVEELQALLADNADFQAQRHLNMAQMLARHDWRWRITTLCELAGLPQPAVLQHDLQVLQQLSARMSADVALPGVAPNGQAQ
ncbi:MAG: glycosyltransferase [Rhodoferax sp.]